MLRRWLGGAAALLVLGLSVSVHAADDGLAPSSGDHWFDKLNPFAGKKKSDEVPKIPPTVPLPGNTGTAATGSSAPAGTPAVVDRENAEDAWIRRNDVCLKLMQIALDTGNKELERQVELLQKRVDEVYRARTSGHAAKFESDEAVLNQHLGTNRGEVKPTERTPADKRTANVREERE